SYVVSIDERSCVTPCNMRVAPGPQRLIATGGTSIDTMIVVPAGGGTFRLSTGRQPRIGSGIAFTGIGFAIAVSLWSASYGCPATNRSCVLAKEFVWPPLGGAMFVGGIGALAWGASHATPRGVELILS